MELRKSSLSWARCGDKGAHHLGVPITLGCSQELPALWGGLSSRARRGDGALLPDPGMRWGWAPPTQGTHPVLVPGARRRPQLHTTEDPVLAVEEEVQQVDAVEAAHTRGHGCEAAGSGP